MWFKWNIQQRNQPFCKKFLSFNYLFYVYLYLHAWCTWKPEEGARSPKTGVTDECQSPSGCWKSNPGVLEEQQVLLIVEPSLQPICGLVFFVVFFLLLAFFNLHNFLPPTPSMPLLLPLQCTSSNSLVIIVTYIPNLDPMKSSSILIC